ncbi:MAG: sulfatase-like hydrolase/transferase [Deltaproteobacteria bacterium]|jgi:arylsulfatase A-like enzyme|nr:sulfatase-like hydrolase/transferase [Deltaproteobacteria bacterium]
MARINRSAHASKPALLGALLASLIAACDSNPSGHGPNAELDAPSTVVLVSIDTWRRDATGFLGGLDPSPTPFLDQLARHGFVAADAMAPVPLTGPSHWSMLSGRWPWRDAMRVNGDRPSRSEDSPNLPELLRGHGWRTAAFISCAALSERLGFATGFDHFDEQFHQSGELNDLQMAERRADATIASALSWLEAQESDTRIFFWIHLFDPHRPYESASDPWRGERAAYYAEIAFADQQLARFERRLADLGRPLERSLWVVLSDHGEALGAHGEDTHGLLLHGATTRIPLLIAGRSVRRGQFEAPSSTVDVLPTILGALNLTTPSRDGIDLLREANRTDRAIPLESVMSTRAFGMSPVIGLRRGPWLWEASPADHLWDLYADPAEAHDLAASRPDQVRELKRIRNEFGFPDASRFQKHDQETVEQLRALGYVETAAEAGTGDVREFYAEGAQWYKEITTNLTSGNYTRAEIYAKKAVERYPNSPDIWINAAFAAVGLQDYAAAERRFRAALALEPRSTPPRLNLANVLLQVDRLDEAEVEYRRVLSDDPDNPMGMYNLGMLLIRQDRSDEGAVFWREFAEIAPDHPRTAAVESWLSASDYATGTEDRGRQTGTRPVQP